MRIIFTSLLLLSLIAMPASGDYWEVANNGMQAWSFTDIIIDPSNPQILYACGPAGIYKSTNGGAGWSASGQGLVSSFVLDLAIDPSSPNVLYAVSALQAGGRGVWKSTDSGATWAPKSAGIVQPYINSVCVFQGDTQVLYAGTNVGGASGGVFKSVNAGESWSYIAGDQVAGSGMGNDAAPIVCDPADSSYVFCGKNSYDGFARSTDGGAHWSWRDYSFVIKHLAIHPVDTSRIFAGGTGFLKISRDRGLSLQSTSIQSSTAGIAVAPSAPDVVYAGVIGQPLHRSDDRGDTWAAVGTEAHNWEALAVHPADPDIIYAATGGEGILKSVDGGRTWAAVNGGLPTQMRVTKMVSSQRYHTVWAIVDNRALFASSDDGANWEMLASISGYPGDLTLDASDAKTLYIANGELIRSRDLGRTWQPVAVVPGQNIRQVEVDPSNGLRLYVYDASDEKIKRSVNGGLSWEPLVKITASPGWGNVGVSDIAIDPADPRRVYAGTLNHVWRSDDGGDSWHVLSGPEYTVIYNNKPVQTSFVRDVAIDPVEPNVVYASTQWGGSWKSADYGNTWARMSFPGDTGYIHNNFQFDPDDHRTLYVCTLYEGMYRSTNAGASWTQFTSGLAPSENGTIYQIAISPWDSTRMFGAAYYGGVYRGGGPPYVPTLADAKGLLPDGVLFAFPEEMVVSAVMPDGAAYVQKTDRSHGVRVRDVAGVGPGDI